jgi:hypothetical protein
MTRSAHSGALSQNALRCALCGSRGSSGGDPSARKGTSASSPRRHIPVVGPVVPTGPSQATRLDGVTVTARPSARRPALRGGGPDRQSAVLRCSGAKASGPRSATPPPGSPTDVRRSQLLTTALGPSPCSPVRGKTISLASRAAVSGRCPVPIHPPQRQPRRGALATQRQPHDCPATREWHGRPTTPPLADPLQPPSGPPDDKNEETP